LKKVKDLTSFSFELLKYDKRHWGSLWKELVYSNAPTLFSGYMLENHLDWSMVISYYDSIERRTFDRLYWKWQRFSQDIKGVLFESAGRIYRQSMADFGIFLSVGINRSTYSFIQTKKGVAMLIDISVLWGVQNEKELGKIFQVDEITALFTDNYQRIHTRTR